MVALLGTHHVDIFRDAFCRYGGRKQHWMSREIPLRIDWFKSAVSGHDSAATSMNRDFEVAPHPRFPVTALLIDPDVSKPTITGPGNSGTFPQAISAALCSAVRIFCGTSKSAFKYAAKYWYGNCFHGESPTRQRSGQPRSRSYCRTIVPIVYLK